MSQSGRRRHVGVGAWTSLARGIVILGTQRLGNLICVWLVFPWHENLQMGATLPTYVHTLYRQELKPAIDEALTFE